MQEKTRRPQRFDAFRLAAGGGELHGSVVPARLPRLEDRIAEGQGRIDWTIRGSADALGRPAIVVSVASVKTVFMISMSKLSSNRALRLVNVPVAKSLL